MTNALAVCLLSLTVFCADLSLARQQPKECNKGPTYWCQNLIQAADCGAVGHCIATVWETQADNVTSNLVSNKFVTLFRDLKDVKDMINMNYLSTRMQSACRSLPTLEAKRLCKFNTAHYESYIMHLLTSETTPETMCQVIGMCNNAKLDNLINPKKNNDAALDTPKETLLGASKCTWGPSYWCSNFTTGRECKATKHCVERVWGKMEFPEDTDDICKICTDMVTQARNQLESNETQEELKQVFEGSCNLIPIKIVRKECIKLADDFVPELVETLASQMNPQAVCSVAGLCNNARIDQLLFQYNTQIELRKDCNECQHTVGVLRKRFDDTSYDDFLVGLLQVCGKMGSLSDSCSMVVFKYYENILAALKKDLTPGAVCHVSGQCVYKFHQHNDFELPEVEVETLSANDDVPCEFCEKLVLHLRDVLTANTTELEFQKVLQALCKQTGQFKDECLSLVEQYYPVMYKYLVEELNPAVVCQMMGICGKRPEGQVAPLMPRELRIKVITPDQRKIGRVSIPKQTQVRILGEEQVTPAPAQLPIERMLVQVPQSKPACSFCQYFLHYLQVELSDMNTEEKINEAVQKACDRLPKSVEGECKQFVTEYGPAVVALLVQEIDPSSICPALGLCPQTQEVKKVDINAEKSNCPLCLFAVEQLETMLKNNRTEQSIRKALDSLCNHLSAKLRTECTDFVDAYSNQLVEMLVANMNAQEICVFLKLCKDEVKDPLGMRDPGIDKFFERPETRADRNNFRGKSMLPKYMLEKGKGDIETNEIPDDTVNGHVVKKPTQKTVCVICEFVMKEIDDEIKDKHNEDEIKKIVHNVCKRMPKSVRSDCDQFVEKYADLVISLLSQELEPQEVCRELKLCDPTEEFNKMKEEILNCAVCETVVMAVKKVLASDAVDRNIVHVVEKSCALLPAKYSARCHTLMEIYGDSVIHLIEEYGAKGVCQKIGLCAQSAYYLDMTHKQH